MEATDNKDYENENKYTEDELEYTKVELLEESKEELPEEGKEALEPDGRGKSSARGFLNDLVFYAVLIFVCIYILPNFVIQRTIVDGSSMAETLHDGEHLYVEKLSYRFDALDRFDIIVFYPYGRENE